MLTTTYGSLVSFLTILYSLSSYVFHHARDTEVLFPLITTSLLLKLTDSLQPLFLCSTSDNYNLYESYSHAAKNSLYRLPRQ